MSINAQTYNHLPFVQRGIIFGCEYSDKTQTEASGIRGLRSKIDDYLIPFE
jgi:hypothetical protein